MRPLLLLLTCTAVPPLLAQQVVADPRLAAHATDGSQAPMLSTRTLPSPGDSLRFTSRSLGVTRWRYGILVGAHGDTVFYRSAHADTSVIGIPADAITKLEVNVGNQPPHSQAGKGALIGLMIGGAVGVAAGIATYDAEKGTPDTGCVSMGIPCHLSPVGVGLLCAAGGALYGAVIGAFVHAPSYKPYTSTSLAASIASHVAPTWDPVRRAPGIVASVRF